jgi:hypothetical protein
MVVALPYSEQNKLELDYWKLSHHGSKYSTSPELLKMISCKRFVISANPSIGNNCHPNKETLTRIIQHYRNENITFYFNYKNEKLLSIFAIDKFNNLVFPDEEKISLIL